MLKPRIIHLTKVSAITTTTVQANEPTAALVPPAPAPAAILPRYVSYLKPKRAQPKIKDYVLNETPLALTRPMHPHRDG